ncbi:unnamed protein product [Musa acuminata subsp. malaccensis]|uniref:(wild Malaysian banana) hypothetical protein n=1 Tax=Musa acuminata subsp. malaccensis TaxID=214687 RepID=A0A804L4D1_MUSAM|nr:unnamed protein product [Musa acuminata subsp. malaccensis]
MVREMAGLEKGKWPAEEDEILVKFIAANGIGNRRSLSKNAGKASSTVVTLSALPLICRSCSFFFFFFFFFFFHPITMRTLSFLMCHGRTVTVETKSLIRVEWGTRERIQSLLVKCPLHDNGTQKNGGTYEAALNAHSTQVWKVPQLYQDETVHER